MFFAAEHHIARTVKGMDVADGSLSLPGPVAARFGGMKYRS